MHQLTHQTPASKPGCCRCSIELSVPLLPDTLIARIRSIALNILRANGVQNISLALYTNAVSFDQLLALGTQ